MAGDLLSEGQMASLLRHEHLFFLLNKGHQYCKCGMRSLRQFSDSDCRFRGSKSVTGYLSFFGAAGREQGHRPCSHHASGSLPIAVEPASSPFRRACSLDSNFPKREETEERQKLPQSSCGAAGMGNNVPFQRASLGPRLQLHSQQLHPLPVLPNLN
jgi:hypothetical protein